MSTEQHEEQSGLLEEELTELRERVQILEERSRDEAALKKFILNTITEDIQTKGAGGLLFELIRPVRER